MTTAGLDATGLEAATGIEAMRTVLALMDTNRPQESEIEALDKEARIDRLEDILHSAGGKSYFRKEVHSWLEEQIAFLGR